MITRLKTIFSYRIIIPFLVISIMADFVVLIVSNISALDAIQVSISDLDFTDFYYKDMGLEDSMKEDNIVLVNLGASERDDIGKLIQNISVHHPKVIGIDAFFRKLKDPDKDSVLQASLKMFDNLVLVSGAVWARQNNLDSMEHSHEFFRQNAHTGYANVWYSRQSGFYEPTSIRSFPVRAYYEGNVYYPFSLEVLKLYDPEKFVRYVSNMPDEALINFQGNLANYLTYDYDQVLAPDADLSLLKNKIVLVGYLGDSLGHLSNEDNHYTPLVYSKIEKNLPDMYGLVIHANIISMILKNDLKYELGLIWNQILQIFLYYFFVLWCSLIYNRTEKNYPLLSIISLFIFANILILLTIGLYAVFDLKVNVSYAILYSLFVPDGFEIYKKNVEPYIEKIKLMKWILVIILITLSILIGIIGLIIKSLQIGIFN